ncbi:hypothetical protein MJH12_13940, partial [bacterium]|nr:hypothetical protein [bacterium]
ELEDGRRAFISKKYVSSFFEVKSGVSNLTIRRSNSKSGAMIARVQGGDFLEYNDPVKSSRSTNSYIQIELEDGLVGYISKDYAVFEALTSDSLKQQSRYTIVANKLVRELQVKKVFDDFKSKDESVINFNKFFGFRYRSYLKDILLASPAIKKEFEEDLDSFLWKKPIQIYSSLFDLLFDSRKMSSCGHFILNNQFREASECSKDLDQKRNLVGSLRDYISAYKKESEEE